MCSTVSRPARREALDGIAFVAQDTPLYSYLSVADTLRLVSSLANTWDEARARARLDALGIPLRRKVGKLSGGQQAQVALAVALARHPRLLILDEPVAELDPLARHDFMSILMEAVAADGVSVVLSSHVLSELERVCDYLVLLSRGSVQVAGTVDDLVATHRVLHRAGGLRPTRCDGRAPSCANGAPATAGQPAGPHHQATNRARRAGRTTRATSKKSCCATCARPTRAHCPDPTQPASTLEVGAGMTRDRGQPREEARPGSRPMRGLAWVTWRQHRLALAGVLAVLGGVGVFMLFNGLAMHHAYARLGLDTCGDAQRPDCQSQLSAFQQDYPGWADHLPHF